MPDEIEEFTEWRLTGQPPGDYPPYDFVARDEEHAKQIKTIFENAPGRGWTNPQLRKRTVRIVRTPWVDVDPSEDFPADGSLREDTE